MWTPRGEFASTGGNAEHLGNQGGGELLVGGNEHYEENASNERYV